MPPMPMKAGGMQVRREKNRIISDESRRLMPMPNVASMPVGILFGEGQGQRHVRGQKSDVRGGIREQTQEASEKDGEQIIVLGRRPVFHGHGLDAVLFDAGVQQFLVPFRVPVRVCFVDLSSLHRQQRQYPPPERASCLLGCVLSLSLKVEGFIPLCGGKSGSRGHGKLLRARARARARAREGRGIDGIVVGLQVGRQMSARGGFMA